MAGVYEVLPVGKAGSIGKDRARTGNYMTSLWFSVNAFLGGSGISTSLKLPTVAAFTAATTSARQPDYRPR